MSTPDLAHRAEGCLLGLACGDALGGAVEFRTREEVARLFPGGVREITGGGPHKLELGEITDDTHMAIAIAHACDAGGIDLNRVAANFLAWYRGGPKDIGNATRQALRLLDTGVPWSEAAERLQRESTMGTAGNGTVMRCAPVAVRFRSDKPRMIEASIDTARMTHADPRATWGAVALNQAIVHLLNGGSLGDVLGAAVKGIKEQKVVKAIDQVPTLEYQSLRSGGFVLDTLATSFWCLLNRPSAEEAIVTAVTLGDDADTTGAVTGALAGAAWGAAAMPARWLAVLQVRDEVRELARSLAAWDLADRERRP